MEILWGKVNGGHPDQWKYRIYAGATGPLGGIKSFVIRLEKRNPPPVIVIPVVKKKKKKKRRKTRL